MGNCLAPQGESKSPGQKSGSPGKGAVNGAAVSLVQWQSNALPMAGDCQCTIAAEPDSTMQCSALRHVANLHFSPAIVHGQLHERLQQNLEQKQLLAALLMP